MPVNQEERDVGEHTCGQQLFGQRDPDKRADVTQGAQRVDLLTLLGGCGRDDLLGLAPHEVEHHQPAN